MNRHSILLLMACLLAGPAVAMTNISTTARNTVVSPDGHRSGTGVVASVNSNGTINIDGATYIYRPQLARVLDGAGRPMSRPVTPGMKVNFTAFKDGGRERIVEIAVVGK